MGKVLNFVLTRKHTFAILSSILKFFVKLSSPIVDLGPVSSTKLLSTKRRKIELFPEPYSPQRITLRAGVLEAMTLLLYHVTTDHTNK